MRNPKLIFGNLFSNEVKIDSDMFHTRMKDRIRTYICCPYIITIDHGNNRKNNTKFLKEMSEPVNLNSSGASIIDLEIVDCFLEL